MVRVIANVRRQMAYCPSCGDEIPGNALECSTCRATFGPESAWQPLSAPPPDRDLDKIARLRAQRTQSRDRTAAARYTPSTGVNILIALAVCWLIVGVMYAIGMALAGIFPDCRIRGYPDPCPTVGRIIDRTLGFSVLFRIVLLYASIPWAIIGIAWAMIESSRTNDAA